MLTLSKSTAYKILILFFTPLLILAIIFFSFFYRKNNAPSSPELVNEQDFTKNTDKGINESKEEFKGEIKLKLVAEGLTSPVALTSPDDNSGRVFIVDQIGIIKMLDAQGKLIKEPFLDLRKNMVKLDPGYDERGLLGMAFHPDFKNNRKFYLYYSAPLRNSAPRNWNHTSRLAEFLVDSVNPNKADLASERMIMEIDQPQANHNGGHIAFDPDGYLYIPLGDGGRANDTGIGHPAQGNGQDLTTLLGSILRIDINKGNPYSIPEDNPFLNNEGKAEIYAYGFRNPYHLSFDAGGNRALITGDAGQNLWEEIDLVIKGGNYGWNLKEGTHCFNPNNADQSPANCAKVGKRGEALVDPIIEYKNNHTGEGIGTAVIGGYVYRGKLNPGLYGKYVFGDWSKEHDKARGAIFFSEPLNKGDLWKFKELKITASKEGGMEEYLLGFGQDASLELYVLTSRNNGPRGNGGKVYRIE